MHELSKGALNCFAFPNSLPPFLFSNLICFFLQMHFNFIPGIKNLGQDDVVIEARACEDPDQFVHLPQGSHGEWNRLHEDLGSPVASSGLVFVVLAFKSKHTRG